MLYHLCHQKPHIRDENGSKDEGSKRRNQSIFFSQKEFEFEITSTSTRLLPAMQDACVSPVRSTLVHYSFPKFNGTYIYIYIKI
jgi:hypothetical protein